ncbi:porin [Parahaliea aestuarii]|uniref:Porin n=1 Tax=Parahaliea aestuarii TaxID=1852021 RepID=A0A5C8ZNN3_9GAMM|nr:porin [Parahaliea aestuarii]TXS89167.1 porin [Parahaliea aestuarii]
MNHCVKAVLAASALIHTATPAFAAVELGEHAMLSAFGTTGLVVTDNDDVEYVRDGQPSGATTDPEFKVDTNLGVQLNVNATDWLSGTVQLLTQQRSEMNLDTEVEWAFLAVEPLDGLRLRAGRTALPMFMISDTRNVGYANNWVRPPDEVYGMALLHRLDGIDLSYRWSLGAGSLTLTALAGESEMNTSGIEAEAKDVRGLTARWEGQVLTLRAGHVESEVELEPFGIPGGATDDYSFSNVGVIFDRDNLVAQAEYVQRRAEDYGQFADADGWYVMGGYRIGDVLPYAIYSRTEPEEKSPAGQMSGEQSTIAAGLRWDAFSAVAIKFQLDYVDTHGTPGISFATPPLAQPLSVLDKAPVLDDVVVASVAIDFVF